MTDLEARPLARVLLEVAHGGEHLAMTAGHEADGTEDLEDGRLRLHVLGGQTLRDHPDAGRVREDVRSPLLVANSTTSQRLASQPITAGADIVAL